MVDGRMRGGAPRARREALREGAERDASSRARRMPGINGHGHVAAGRTAPRPTTCEIDYGAFVLNRRVDLYAIGAPARWRGDAGSPLDGASGPRHRREMTSEELSGAPDALVDFTQPTTPAPRPSSPRPSSAVLRRSARASGESPG